MRLKGLKLAVYIQLWMYFAVIQYKYVLGKAILDGQADNLYDFAGLQSHDQSSQSNYQQQYLYKEAIQNARYIHQILMDSRK